MKLGEKILELRKKKGLSQEQLGQRLNVTRQTISNWELGDTSPNPEQLKLISKELNISIDELLDNDIKSVLVEKGSNTEKLAGLVLRVLKCLGIIFIVITAIDIISLIVFSYVKSNDRVDINEVIESTLECSIDNNDYLITIKNDGYFNCSNCNKKLQKELKDNYIEFNDINKSTNNIIGYFKNNNGTCE